MQKLQQRRAQILSVCRTWPIDVKAGNIDFELCIATPATMRVVGQLGQILGPRGIMPNPKVGTVTTDVAKAQFLMPNQGRCSFVLIKRALFIAPSARRLFLQRIWKRTLMQLLLL